jgi:hypothetical protein
MQFTIMTLAKRIRFQDAANIINHPPTDLRFSISALYTLLCIFSLSYAINPFFPLISGRVLWVYEEDFTGNREAATTQLRLMYNSLMSFKRT